MFVTLLYTSNCSLSLRIKTEAGEQFLINTILLHIVEATNNQRVIPEVPIPETTFTTKEAPGKYSFSGVVDYMLVRTSDECFALSTFKS